jgi:membrane protein YdbS with pleckstrin-like domain
VFRASRKLYYLRLIRWSFGQLAALVGILFWLGVVLVSEREAEKARNGNASLPTLKSGHNMIYTAPLRNVPPVVFKLLWVAKAAGVLVYLSQLLITYAFIRLDYELRWYIVTDRSLRIRSGLWTMQEITMSFANLQQVAVSQGPLQRLLGISDVRVESAGGGGDGSSKEAPTRSMHAGVFHGVENANQIRDLILERLKHFRGTGLGDPDEPEKSVAMPGSQVTQRTIDQHQNPPTVTMAPNEVLEASRELLTQAKKLRATWLETSADSLNL